MRISDWSSDVCSSDLQVSSVADSSGQAVKRSLKGEAVIIEANSRTYYALLGKPDEPEYGQKVANYALLPLVPEFRRNPETDMLAVERGTESLDRMAATQRAMVKIAGQIGRASCRERVCTYV